MIANILRKKSRSRTRFRNLRESMLYFPQSVFKVQKTKSLFTLTDFIASLIAIQEILSHLDLLNRLKAFYISYCVGNHNITK